MVNYIGIRELHLELEPHCILNCKHCSSYLLKKAAHCGYTEKDLIALLKEIDSPVDMFLTGGEPLLFKGLNTFMSNLSSIKPDCSFWIFTTGLLQNDGNLAPISFEYSKILHQSGLKGCYVSVYDIMEDGHDYITNYKGSLTLTKQAIQNMRMAGIDVKLNVVVTKQNYNHLDKIIEMASKWGVSEVRFLKLINHGNAENHWSELGISESEYKKSILKFFNSSDRHPVNITISGYPQIKACRPYSDAIGCEAGKQLLYITYSGDVFPCACVKNNQSKRIAHISETFKIVDFCVSNKDSRVSCLVNNEE